MRWGVREEFWFEGNSGARVSVKRDGENKPHDLVINTEGNNYRRVTLTPAEFAALQNIMRIIDGSEPGA